MPSLSELNLTDLDVDRLSPEARATLKIVQRITNPRPGMEEPAEEVLAELGISEADYGASVNQLAAEWVLLSGKNTLPPMTSEEFAALRDSISAVGQQYPILRGPNGEIVDGYGRLRACRDLGREPWIIDVTGTAEELESLAFVVNMARRHLTTDAKRGTVKAQILRDYALRPLPVRSDRAIADYIGVSHRTVASVRAELERNGEVDKLSTRIDRRGVERPATQPARERPVQQAAEPENGLVDVTLRIAPEIAAQISGQWLPCKAVRLSEIADGIYSLELQT